MSKQTIAVGYIRVSTSEQAAEGVSLEAQRAKIEAYAALNGLELADVFTDAGISGKAADNRPGLQAALAKVCSEKGTLVCYSLSRLARSTADTLAIAEQLDKADADLASISEKIDTSTAAGKMVFRMLAVLAEFERDQLAERTSTAMQHKRRKLERVGRVPVGYDLADDGISLTPNAAEQRAVEIIRELRTLGMSMRAIAAELNKQGIAAKHGGAWKHSTIQRVLERTA
jgi:site-specific DNA recombinase